MCTWCSGTRSSSVQPALAEHLSASTCTCRRRRSQTHGHVHSEVFHQGRWLAGGGCCAGPGESSAGLSSGESSDTGGTAREAAAGRRRTTALLRVMASEFAAMRTQEETLMAAGPRPYADGHTPTLALRCQPSRTLSVTTRRQPCPAPDSNRTLAPLVVVGIELMKRLRQNRKLREVQHSQYAVGDTPTLALRCRPSRTSGSRYRQLSYAPDTGSSVTMDLAARVASFSLEAVVRSFSQQCTAVHL